MGFKAFMNRSAKTLGRTAVMQISLGPFVEEIEEGAKKLEGIPVLGDVVKVVEELGDPEIKASISAVKDVKKDIDKGRKYVEKLLGIKEQIEEHIDNHRSSDQSSTVAVPNFESNYGHSSNHFEHGGTVSAYAGSNASMIMTS